METPRQNSGSPLARARHAPRAQRLAGMALAHPQNGLHMVAWCALAVAFASATQDIALDAWRIESAPAQQQPPPRRRWRCRANIFRQ